MYTVEELLGNPNEFLKKIFDSLKKDKVDVSKLELDHICYRVETLGRYNELRESLLELGSLLTESQIGGRAISSFKLNKPLIYKDRKIWCVELPSPKKGSFYAEGYEHVEFVIDLDFNKFEDLHSNVEFDKRAISKEINPDIIIKYDGFQVKFHHNTLEYVIKYLQ